MENKREVGGRAEAYACEYLARQGMEILERNYRNRYGEVDLIGRQDGYLVFVEVKYRSSLDKGLPQEAVGLKKQRRICAVADFYRAMHGVPLSAPIRYDVVAVSQGKVDWIRNAFPHRERRGW